MKAAFHYAVKAKLIRFVKDGLIDFIKVNEKFENESPIESREQAFKFYQNHIDVLLQGINKKYVSDIQTRTDLMSFINLGASTKINLGEKEFEYIDSYGNGIGVYLVVDQPIEDEDNIGDEYLIHGIGNISREDPQGLMDGLNHEYWYYEYYSYDTKDYKQTVDFYEYDIEATESNEILQTPFDWTGYDIADESAIEQPKEEVIVSKTYAELISGGETNQVEFKAALLYYHNDDELKRGYKKFVRHIVAKVICSFLNSNGGYLFIGVSDNKEIQGLKHDFSLARPEGKDPKDYFSLEVDKLIRDYFKGVASNISGEFVTIDGIEIFVFTVFPCKNRPVFINGLNSKEFYVRLTTSCEPYTDIEDIATYCINKWGQQS
jgi:hypothetical protein